VVGGSTTAPSLMPSHDDAEGGVVIWPVTPHSQGMQVLSVMLRLSAKVWVHRVRPLPNPMTQYHAVLSLNCP
jgi:hypothetical protein